MFHVKTTSILGWVATLLSTAAGCLWAFWGSIENFHEGWYYTSFWQNVGLMLLQYWMPALLLVLLNAVALRWPYVGGGVFIAGAMLIPTLFIQTSAAIFILALPMGVVGLLYLFGRPEPKKWACRLAVGLPLLVLLGGSVEPVIRISGRLDDGNYGLRTIEGNGIRLQWAPAGPGWPGHWTAFSGNWHDADSICRHLNASGTAVLDTPSNIWRLPTVEEAVRSQMRHGRNAGGIWNAATEKPGYQVLPDKETPLWRPHSPIIYWWTSTEINDSTAYRIVYNGSVQRQHKKTRMGDLGFRAVREGPQ